MSLEQPSVRTKSEAAYLTLREAILDGRLAPGSRVTLNALAADLGMSLTPIREALRLLGTQGLVQQHPHRGTRIASLSRDGVEEIYQLRKVLEPLACELAAKRATDDELTGIEDAAAAFEAAAGEGNPDVLPALNADLHRRIYRAARSDYLLEFIDRLWDRIPYQAMSLVRHYQRSATEHREIVIALCGRDVRRSGRSMRTHITNSTQETLRRYDAMEARRAE